MPKGAVEQRNAEPDSIVSRSRPRWSGLWAFGLALAAACVNLDWPSVTACTADSGWCALDAPIADGRREGPPADGVEPDAPSPDAGPGDDGSPPDPDALDPAAPDVPYEVGPDVAPDGSPDVSPYVPADAPVDRAPDLAPDVGPDRPPDTPPDTAPDRAADTSLAGACPTGNAALLICLSFEGSLVDPSEPRATVTGSNIAFEAGISDVAVRMGTSSVIRVGAGWGSIPGDFTLEAWVRPDRLPTGDQRMAVLDEESHFGLFVYPGGRVVCSSTGAEVEAQNAVAVGAWTGLACTASGDTLVLWVNGVARDQQQTDGMSNGGTSALGIGGNLPSGDPFEGSIDNVRVWNQTRTAPQICAQSPSCP